MEHTHQKKHFSEEETLEKVEQKIDEKMEKIMKQSFIHTFLNLKIVKDVLASHVVNYANHKIHQSLKMIFSIVGRISLIAGVIGIFEFLMRLSGLGFMFNLLGAALGIRVLIYILVAFGFSLLSILTGIGMVRFKKRAISLIVLGFFASAILLVISLIPVGLDSYNSYGSFGGSLFNIIITSVLLILVLKNEAMFKN